MCDNYEAKSDKTKNYKSQFCVVIEVPNYMINFKDAQTLKTGCCDEIKQ